MSERGELPEGWRMLATTDGKFRAWLNRNEKPRCAVNVTQWCDTRSGAVRLAWRIVDAEKELSPANIYAEGRRQGLEEAARAAGQAMIPKDCAPAEAHGRLTQAAASRDAVLALIKGPKA